MATTVAGQQVVGMQVWAIELLVVFVESITNCVAATIEQSTLSFKKFRDPMRMIGR